MNEAEDPSTYASTVWSFDTAPYGIVDDFEDFDGDNPIWKTWLDGLGFGVEGTPGYYPGNGTGSAVGTETTASTTEETVVRSGKQSMPLAYEGSVSEATLMLDDQDWTANGITTLSLMVYGDRDNTGQLYVKIGGTKLLYDGDLGINVWKAWNIDLSTTGANLTSVSELTIGIENGSGMLYVDDIRLYPKGGGGVSDTLPVMHPDSDNDASLVVLSGSFEVGSQVEIAMTVDGEQVDINEAGWWESRANTRAAGGASWHQCNEGGIIVLTLTEDMMGGYVEAFGGGGEVYANLDQLLWGP